MTILREEKIKKAVREHYGALAHGAACCGEEAGASRVERLYQTEWLKVLPASVTEASAGCGDPVTLGSLLPGETVLDLGSGGGIDCFLAAQEVGSEGKVIGVDMTPEMVALARQNASKLEAHNVEFRLGEIEHLPVETESVDVIISNCVINLSPDKGAVFHEALRVLRPGGRLSVSDMVLVGPLPEESRGSLDQWAACVAGALPKEDYLRRIRAAGFTEVTVAEEHGIGEGDPVASIRVRGVKPQR